MTSTACDTEDVSVGIVHLDEARDGIAILRLGADSESVVTLTERRLNSLRDTLQRLRDDTSVRGLIVTGSTSGMFAAGADISLIEAITDPAEGVRAARTGQTVFAMFQELTIPVVGAIEGPCLGGGYEMALCFDLRVASDHPATSIGLPEVKLGIVPGFGGTQRLPRLIGIPKALDLILKGRALRADAARRAGLVDRVVASEQLMAAAQQEVRKLCDRGIKRPKRTLRGMAFWMSHVGLLRSLVRKKVAKTLSNGPGRFYEAPPTALSLCLDAFAHKPEVGLQREAEALGKLVVSPTCKALVRLFFLMDHAKRLGKADDAADVSHAHIVGGGAMGAGIGGLMARKGLRVRLCDLSADALSGAKQRLQKVLSKLRKRRRIKPHEATGVQDRLAVSTSWGRLDRTDFFLEAVVENLDVKRRLFAQAIEAGLPPTAILASNTSSLPIDAMAEGLENPERVIGLHFFNPPEKMPLVEVVVGPRTSPATIATTCKLAVQMGKSPVVVKDSPGFLVNRCLAPYMNEAAVLMLEGCDPKTIDKVMLDFGLPMGPARLLDEVGFDVAGKVSEVMSTAFADRMKPCELFQAMVDAGHLGTKTGGGILSDGGAAVLAELRTGPPKEPSRSEILERLIYPMVDEAYRCLDEGLVASEQDIDLGMVMGMGFPPFTGGITRYAAAEGHGHIVARLRALAATHGERFLPGEGLLKFADS
ncbi:MAG: 3-hydroxyacyl-CoA dehydrogenase NAD-binding domain-containing protein [Planctomycetota bacterium]|nr:3-hydroxyacyl-CoA dehydrogenase NAD-binding domain-containing protein [Planctomycetota bacterium]